MNDIVKHAIIALRSDRHAYHAILAPAIRSCEVAIQDGRAKPQADDANLVEIWTQAGRKIGAYNARLNDDLLGPEWTDADLPALVEALRGEYVEEHKLGSTAQVGAWDRALDSALMTQNFNAAIELRETGVRLQATAPDAEALYEIRPFGSNSPYSLTSDDPDALIERVLAIHALRAAGKNPEECLILCSQESGRSARNTDKGGIFQALARGQAVSRAGRPAPKIIPVYTPVPGSNDSRSDLSGSFGSVDDLLEITMDIPHGERAPGNSHDDGAAPAAPGQGGSV